jgi:hypothetical protein
MVESYLSSPYLLFLHPHIIVILTHVIVIVRESEDLVSQDRGSFQRIDDQEF